MSAARLRVTVTDGRGRPTRRAPGLGRWVETHAPARARGTVTIALVGDSAMRRLNRTFLGHDYTTDVLSFPAGADVAPTGASGPRAGALAGSPLGDLAIATGVAARQARQQGHTVATELRVLALHGLLHLLGYDHEVDRGRMRQVEERLRRRAGLPGGLVARQTDRSARP